MSQQVGLFLNPVGQRRVDFQKLCGELFGRLFLADGNEQANDLTAQQQPDLLIIDLERFERSLDLASIGELIARRAGAPTLLLCPFTHAGWLPELMAFGPVSYAISPLADTELRQLVAARLDSTPSAAAQTWDTHDLRAALALQVRLQQALGQVDDVNRMAEDICAVLCTVPGVVHASLFRLDDPGDLELEAQHSPAGLNLARVLHRSDRLLQSPLRHAFPGLLAACTGEMALLDAPAKTGEPELALGLLDKGVEMVLGLPLGDGGGGGDGGGDGGGGAGGRGRAAASGAASGGSHTGTHSDLRANTLTGSLCLMFAHARVFSHEELRALQNLAQLAGFGLRMAALSRENARLQDKVTHLSTVDVLTGVANRRYGEQLLELEIRRARRYKVPAALIGFDIDRFKAINDQYGHPVGDAALRAVVETALASLRTSDVLVRSGGEEFWIIAPHTSAIDAFKMADKIRLAIAATDIPGCDRLTVSMGVAQVADQESGDALLSRVDAALARAKRAGRNCVELAMQ